MSAPSNLPLKVVAAVLLLFAAGAAILFSPVVKGWFDWLNRWAESQGTMGLLVFALVYALATILFIPGSPMTLAAGFIFGLCPGFLAVWVGATLGAAATFLLGRYFARTPVQRWACTHARFRTLDDGLVREAWKVVFLLRLSPLIPYNVINYLFALTGIRFWPYLWASAAGMAPGTLLYVYLGAVGRAGAKIALGESAPGKYYRNFALGIGLVATVIVTVFLARLSQKVLKESSLKPEDLNH